VKAVHEPRLGFIGTGFIAVAHARMLKTAATPFVRGPVFDADPARAAAFAQRGGWRAAGSIEEVLADTDAVIVATWTSEHRRAVEAAAAHGVHVLCEKPLSTTLDDALAMVDAVRTAGLVNQCGLVLRWSPAFVVAAALAREVAAGAVMAVVLRDDQYLPVQGRYASTWRGDAARAGGGVLLEHSVHDLDLLELLLGAPVTKVSAHTSNRHGVPGIEDLAAVTLATADGAAATLTTVWHDNTARESNRHLEVLCERRMITVSGDDWFGPVRYQDPDGVAHVIEGEDLIERATAILGAPPNPDDGFLQAVSEGRPAMPDMSLALRAQQLADAAYRSAASGSAPVTL
jgi:predicted dehydrogenase